jgi:hypothetical protein
MSEPRCATCGEVVASPFVIWRFAIPAGCYPVYECECDGAGPRVSIDEERDFAPEQLTELVENLCNR